MLATFIVTVVVLLVVIALISIRIILVPGGEFRGTCSTNSPFQKREGNCPVCGKTPEELCPSESEQATNQS
jgi:hypothetical protein